MANPNVFQQLIQPVRSFGEYASDLDKQEANRLALDGQRRQNALQDAAFQQQTQKQNALRAAAASWGPTTTDERRIQSLRANPLTFDAADALEASTLKRSETRSKVAKDEAEVEKIKLANTYMVRDRHLQGLANVTDPQQAAAWIGQGVQLGEFTMQQAQQVIQGLQTGQIPLDQWKQRAQQGGMTLQQQAQDRLAQITQAETARHNKSTEALTQRGQDVTASTAIRGQNLTDSRAREANSLTREAHANVYDADRGVLVNKATGLARPAATMDGKPVGPKDKPLAEGAQKQVIGARNLQDAVQNYRDKLSGWSNTQMLKPDARAEMGNAYNNMMLQAKEAYNLGVLNGPDYEILQSVVKDPTKLTSALNSNSALDTQAQELSRIAAGIERTALESHGKSYSPRQPAGASSGPAKISDDAGYNALPSGAVFVGPDGKTRRKP